MLPCENQSKENGDGISSATGTVFTNIKIRTFNGKTKQHDENKIFNNNRNDLIDSIGMKATQHCDRWGVVTTIFDPTDAIIRVATSPSWCLVIVPDTKTPGDYMDKLKVLLQNVTGEVVDDTSEEESSIVYLSIEKQKVWENIAGPFGDFVRSTPWKHFCRKNIGYLFAILHGAQFIFDFDDDNFIKLDDTTGKPMDILPEGNFDEMILENVTVAMQGASAFNHHPMMGASVDNS